MHKYQPGKGDRSPGAAVGWPLQASKSGANIPTARPVIIYLSTVELTGLHATNPPHGPYGMKVSRFNQTLRVARQKSNVER